jgi:hypothetical protein
MQFVYGAAKGCFGFFKRELKLAGGGGGRRSYLLTKFAAWASTGFRF